VSPIWITASWLLIIVSITSAATSRITITVAVVALLTAICVCVRRVGRLNNRFFGRLGLDDGFRLVVRFKLDHRLGTIAGNFDLIRLVVL
jgi:hypothetical protein